MLRRIFGPKREKMVGGWKRQHNEEVYNLHTSSNIIKVIEPQRMGWASHVACMGEIRN